MTEDRVPHLPVDQPERAPNTDPSVGICRLNGEEGKLCRSHILPRFVAEWLIETSLTKGIRTSDVPNRRLEDLQTRHLLCKHCEAILQKDEDVVARRLFRPYHEDASRKLEYDEELARFAVSVSWRVVVYLRETQHLGALQNSPDLKRAEQTWRRFLLGEIPHPGRFQQHLVPVDGTSGFSPTRDELPYLNRYLLRSVGFRPYNFRGRAYVISKVGQWFIVGWITEPLPNEWRNTRVHIRRGVIEPTRYSVPGWVGLMMEDGAKRMRQLLEDDLSQRQSDKLADRMRELLRDDPDSVIDSAAFRAFSFDHEVVGNSATYRFPREPQESKDRK